MKILITGASGNLGGLVARHLMKSHHFLHLIVHKTPLPDEIYRYNNRKIFPADLNDPSTLVEPCRDVDVVLHFAGVLFKPRPEKFLPRTNIEYFKNLAGAAMKSNVRKIVLISFPHVEGEKTPADPARGVLTGNPKTVHSRTRLEEERMLYRITENSPVTPVILRIGMVYGKGILMIEAGRWLARHRLLAVWRRPTWIHLISIPDFLLAVEAAITREAARGIYHIGDKTVITLQEFMDKVADFWGYKRPRRMPVWMIYAAAVCCELFSWIFRTRAPLTREFIRMGMTSYYGDTARMHDELISDLAYPTLDDGIGTL
ncbi:MAG: hypothetical protein A2W19_15305 [Spirochaetes bacterium RBG_16_49_21]|nr:MAG: hypothetical protein A2W19_15305 [Spirochaetes bacterium RBG_16_49_21]